MSRDGVPKEPTESLRRLLSRNVPRRSPKGADGFSPSAYLRTEEKFDRPTGCRRSQQIYLDVLDSSQEDIIMRKSVLALIGLFAALGVLDAATASAQDYLPLLDIT